MLVVSTDQAHSLGDVFGVAVSPTSRHDPVRVPVTGAGAGGLDALALDTTALLEVRWRELATVVRNNFPDSDLGSVAPEEIVAVPGIQEMLGLHEVGELAAAGRWDRVIVDCASTADALRMLTLPAAVEFYAERAWPRHRRLAGAPNDSRIAVAAGLLERIGAGAERLKALLTDGESAGAHLVLTAERVVAAEAARTLSSLTLAGVRVEELIVNQVLLQDDSFEYANLPAHPAFDWYAERIADQHRVLDELTTTVADSALVLTPHLAGEPIGPDALGELLGAARRRDGAPPPAPLAPVVDLESGTGLGSVYRLRLQLPRVDSGALTLGRVDDELIIGVGGLRRRMRLASVLRRCTVVNATLRGSELTVRFRPDPEVWPK